jgi:2'-5' RNA ligase
MRRACRCSASEAGVWLQFPLLRRGSSAFANARHESQSDPGFGNEGMACPRATLARAFVRVQAIQGACLAHAGAPRRAGSSPGRAIQATPVPAAMNSRKQLTLFVPEPWSSCLEALRRALDPVQAALIAAHVTLCREDEIAGRDSSSIVARVASWSQGPIRLTFGHAVRFDGHGILLPCERGSSRFQGLRQWLLQDSHARQYAAHLTLAHPRNARSAGNTDASLAACPRGLQVEFASVSLIEQRAGAPWEVIEEATLGRDVRKAAQALDQADPRQQEP